MAPDIGVKTSWPARLMAELRALLLNLWHGSTLLAFRPRAFARMHVSHDQLLLLLILYLLASITGSYFAVERPVFDVTGLGYLGADLLASLLAGYAIVKFTGRQERLLAFLVACYSLAPAFYLISDVLYPRLPQAWWSVAEIGMLVWSLAITCFIAFYMVERRLLRTIVVAALWVIVSLPLLGMPRGFWQEDYDYFAQTEEARIDAERVFYSQYDLLEQMLDPLRPGEPGTADLFFVGFGAYAGQDVFMKEVAHIREKMDAVLGTGGRSVTLVNHRDTLDDMPLASATNLGIVLRHLGKVMDPDEDVLLIYLTSHGSPGHDLAVDMWPLELNDLGPHDLKAMLDESGVRWRIILVSACYSGGFVEPLRDDHTLILTAAAQDKTSFGCSSANEYTYFGEALFKELAAGPYQFVPRFNEAIVQITRREQSEG